MKNQNRINNHETLEAGLDFWCKQEQKFQSLFGKESLKDKEFLKMKLRHYDNLWYNYRHASLSIEGQLMRNMLKFQRAKLGKSLHHGLGRRIIRRLNTAIGSGRTLKGKKKKEKRNRLAQFNQRSPQPAALSYSKDKMVRPAGQIAGKQGEKVAENQQQNDSRQNKFYSQNINPMGRVKHRGGKGLY